MSEHEQKVGDGNRPPVRVHVPEAARRGVYANLALVSHSEHEVTLDLCQVQQDRDGEEIPAVLVTRVHLPPTLVPSLIESLRATVDAYQRQFPAQGRQGGPEPAG